ncbi:MAG TPA: ferritin-like domain-containing protein [Solirubrobacteraceae bacterium]|jgi:starvation-inducible DNA-binding protein
MPRASASAGATGRRRIGDAGPPPSRVVQRRRTTHPFGTLCLLPVGLPAEVCLESARLVNRILADTMILDALYTKSHWSVAGPTFYELHLLFDAHAGEQLELIDALAERVRSLGAVTVGDPRHAAELARIERPPDGAEDPGDIIAAVREAIDHTERSRDWGRTTC